MPRTIDEYVEGARTTAIYPGRGTFLGMLYTALGLAGEVGELVETVKKTLREEPDFVILHLLHAIKDMLDQGQGKLTLFQHDQEFETLRILLSKLQPLPELSEDRKEKMVGEAGDVSWYQAGFSDELKIPLADIFFANLLKLKSRQERGVLHGSGDNR